MSRSFKKFFLVFALVVVIFMPFQTFLGNFLEFRTAIPESKVFWLMHWYEPILVICFLLLFFGCFGRRKNISGLPQILALLLISFGVISAIFISPSISRGLEGFRFTLLSLIFFLFASQAVIPVSFVIPAKAGIQDSNNSKKKFLSSLTTCYLLLATAIALWALVERFLPLKYWNEWGLISPDKIFGWGWHSAGGFLQSASILGGPNQLGSYLLPALFLAVYRIQITKNWNFAHKTAYYLLTTVILLAIILTFSRSALVGLIAGLIIWFFFFIKPKFSSYTISMAGLSVLAAMFFLFFFQNHENFRLLVTHNGQTGHADAFWASVNFLKQNSIGQWFLGHGLGTAGPLAIKYGDGLISESWYLQILIELGLIGLFLWLGLIFTISKNLIKQKEAGLFLGLLAVSVAAIFLHTWADNPAIAYTLFILMGLAFNEEKH